MQKINIAKKFSLFSEYFTPKIIAELNENYVKLAKIKGDFPWHSHEAEDEFFLVFTGNLTIEFRDGEVKLGPGEMCIVPKGVEHRTLAEEETQLMLIEPKSTAHLGTVESEQTVAIEKQEWI